MSHQKKLIDEIIDDLYSAKGMTDTFKTTVFVVKDNSSQGNMSRGVLGVFTTKEKAREAFKNNPYYKPFEIELDTLYGAGIDEESRKQSFQ